MRFGMTIIFGQNQIHNKRGKQMEKLINKEKANKTREKINNNFEIVSKHLAQNILSLPTSERLSLSESYLSLGLRVYDTTLEQWFEYTQNGWEQCELSSSYVYFFSKESWTNGTISIPYSLYKKRDPVVQVYILTEDNVYDNVIGGFQMDDLNNIILCSDTEYDGKVVIK